MAEKIKIGFGKLIRWQYAPLLILLFVILGLHLSTITRPDELVFDEQHYIQDARRIITGEGSERVEHPPLAKLIIVGGMKLFGDNPWGWRLPAVLLSTVALAAFYDICRKLGTSHKIAFIATMLLGLDNLMFIHSGLAMLDIYLVVLSLFAFWCYLKGPRWWWLSAVSVGLAGLCKFSGVLTIIPIGLHWFISSMGKPLKNNDALTDDATRTAKPIPALNKGAQATKSSTKTHLHKSASKEIPAPLSLWQRYSNPVIFISSMLLAPLTFFLFYGLLDAIIFGEWKPFIVWGSFNEGVLGTIRHALSLTSDIKFAYGGAFPSRPWEWIMSPSGSLYFYGALFHPENYKDILLAYWFTPSYTGMINPSMWLGGLLVIPYAIRQSLKKHNVAIFVLCWGIGTWGVWLPMCLYTNRITYMFYYLPTLGAIAIGLALILAGWLRKAQTHGNSKSKYILMLATVSFLLVHLLSFCILSPLHLWVSLPICVALLLFTMWYLDLGWRFIIQFCIAACISVIIMRFGLYWLLNKWLVKDIAPWGLPEVSSLWTVSTLIGLALAWGIFIAFGRLSQLTQYVLGKAHFAIAWLKDFIRLLITHLKTPSHKP